MRDSKEMESGLATDESERGSNKNTSKKQIQNMRERQERGSVSYLTEN